MQYHLHVAELTACASWIDQVSQLGSVCVMASSIILRTRVDAARKRRVDGVLKKIGITPSQAINMLYAQIELRKGLPFPVVAGDNADLAVPDEHYGSVMARLDE